MVDIAMLDPEKAAQIILPGGEVALVDQGDLTRTLPYQWYVAQTSRKTGKPKRYVLGYIQGVGRPAIYLHRLVLEATKGSIVDHINGDTLDCRKINLRFATWNQNAHNRAANATRNGRPCTSKFKGVCQEGAKWRATICYMRQIHRIGVFESEINAAEAYDDFSYWLHGEFGFRNFPERQTRDFGLAPIVTQKCVTELRSVQSFKITDVQRRLEGK